MNLYNPKLIITVDLLCFAVAFIDSLFVSYYDYDCWFRCLHLIGKLGAIGTGVCLAWLFVSTLIKNKV